MKSRSMPILDELMQKANQKIAAQEKELIDLRVKCQELVQVISLRDEEIEELRAEIAVSRW